MALSRRQFVQVCGLGAASVAGAGVLAGCGGTSDPAKAGSSAAAASDVANKDKPVVFYNRQPSNSKTGELDMTTLKFNDNTYYVGFDATQGGELQGQMIVEYITAHADEIDKNGDGTIGYVLAIGDVGHNDSIARTRGIRKALGTGVEVDGKIDPSPENVKEGSLDVNGKTFKVVELAAKEMKNSAGATWDAATAGDTINAWADQFSGQIDIVVSNNDGMGMAIFNKWSKEAGVPTFGYDANNDAVAAIAEGYAGTISQNPAVQAYLTLRLLRNAIDGVDVETGIGTADDAGNVLSEEDFKYNEDDRSFYAMNLEVTADNYKDFLDPTTLYKTAQSQLDEKTSPKKKVWLSTYNSADNFLGSTYKPLLKKYEPLLNFTVDYVDGDGQNESNITNRLGDPSAYDAFAINMVKTDNGASYTQLLA